MNLLLLIAQTSLLLSGSQAAKLLHPAETQNDIQNELQNKHRSDPHDNEESLEQQEEEEGLNQTVHAGQGNLVPISQSNFGSLGDLRSDLVNNRHGSQGIFNQGITKQGNQNFPSIKSTQFHTQGIKDSVATGASSASQGATSSGNSEQNSIFFRTNQNGPQNFGPREVHTNAQSGIRQETKLGFGSNQGTSRDAEEYNQTPGTNAGFTQDDGRLGFDHGISNNGLSPGFEHNKRTSNFGFGVSQSDNLAISGHRQITDSVLRTAQASHATGSSHGTSNTFVHGVPKSDTELSPGFEHNQGPSNFGFGVSKSDNSVISGHSQVTDSALRTAQASHATGSSHGTSNNFVHGLSKSDTELSPGFDHNQGPSNFGFGVRQSDNSAIPGYNQVTDSGLRTAQASHAIGSSHGNSNTFVHGLSGSDTGFSSEFEHNQGPSNFGFGFSQSDNSAISGYNQVTNSVLRTALPSHATGSSRGFSNTFVHGVSRSDNGLSPSFEHNQGPSNVGFGVSQRANSAISGYSQVTDSAFRTTQASHATDLSHGTPNTFVHGISGSGFRKNTAVRNNAAIHTEFGQSTAKLGAQFGKSTSGSAARFDKDNKVKHEQQSIGFNTGFSQGNIGASNALNQAISSPQSHANTRNRFGQSVSSTGVRHRSSNQQDRSKPEIFKFNLVHESSGTVDNFGPLDQSTSVRSNIVSPNNIGSLSTSRGSRAELGFGGLRQTNLIQQTGRGVHPAQIPFRQNQVISSNPTFFDKRNPNSHVTQQHIPSTSANQESTNNAASQININSIENTREVNSLGVQTRQKVYNAVRQAGTSSQVNQTPEFLPRNQLSQESSASDGVFNNLQSSIDIPVIFDSQRQRIFSHERISSSNTGNRGFRGSTNSQTTRHQTHLNTPNQSNSINQGYVRNIENESTVIGQQILHQRNEIPPVVVVGTRTPNESYNNPNLG